MCCPNGYLQGLSVLRVKYVWPGDKSIFLGGSRDDFLDNGWAVVTMTVDRS
jgi:hypothetical protein